jgi:hypothetical protein
VSPWGQGQGDPGRGRRRAPPGPKHPYDARVYDHRVVAPNDEPSLRERSGGGSSGRSRSQERPTPFLEPQEDASYPPCLGADSRWLRAKGSILREGGCRRFPLSHHRVDVGLTPDERRLAIKTGAAGTRHCPVSHALPGIVAEGALPTQAASEVPLRYGFVLNSAQATRAASSGVEARTS